MSRVFEPFPATHAARSFARTWWGKAWVGAVEDVSLDSKQLRRGRAYARRGHVGAILVEPGRVVATVRDASLEEFRAAVSVEQLTDAQWDRFGDEVAAKSGHLLALLDGEMPAELVESAAAADVPLLPTFGDLEPECDCDAWEIPCVHAAALAYQVSWLLDTDPFVLMLLRGRGEDALVGRLRTRVAEPTDDDWRGDDAAEAYAREPAPLPRWEFAPAYQRGEDVPPGPGIDPDAMRRLVASAAARAADLLASPG
ncbi:SWIM zinc finger family protein [Solicola gregarius]|uniref:SWIM-type domain-containing protein n=1 Tax=Solicola gregarius TaxID=2908642 RepID=A0AA46TKX5_9ACTN|nr:SWIM zinc finger family protein [Solicola gregarius]UYM06797.1 hypothetical protein L0C25_06905 [Solicola gregarius]